jgi:hypothetical protein
MYSLSGVRGLPNHTTKVRRHWQVVTEAGGAVNVYIWKKIMMIKNILIRLWPLYLIIIIFSFFQIRGCTNNKEFYKNSFGSIVIKRNNWQLRATEFHLDNGIRIDSAGLPGVNYDLKVGDSISKFANSNEFKVYRKLKDDKFELLHQYFYGW